MRLGTVTWQIAGVIAPAIAGTILIVNLTAPTIASTIFIAGQILPTISPEITANCAPRGCCIDQHYTVPA